MISLKIKVVGREKIISKLRILQTLVEGGAVKGLRESMDDIEKASSDYLDNMTNWGAGATRPTESINENWIRQGPEVRGGNIQACLGNSSPHSHIVEFGSTGPITPVGGSPLHFIYMGEEMWRWSVRGQQPMRYFTTGIQLAKPLARDHIRESIRGNIRTVFK